MPERFNDPVLEEIHAIRAAMLAAAGGEIGLLMQQVGDRQRRSNRQVIREPLRKRVAPRQKGKAQK